MAGIVLSADIGTSSLKAALIDLDGHLIAFGREAYDPGIYGSKSQWTGVRPWEEAFAKILTMLYAQAQGRVIDALCFSGNGPTLVPITEDGEELPPIFWHNEKKSSTEGISSFFLPHVAWYKENSGVQYKKAKFFLSPNEWLSHKLGARAITAIPSRAYRSFYWDDEQCGLLGLDINKFPPYEYMGTNVGELSQNAASAWGPFFGNCLKSGTPIIAGAPDFMSALIGTGTMREGKVCDRAGSSEGINYCVKNPDDYFAARNSIKHELRLLPHAKEGFWNIGAVIPSSGMLFEQYRIETGQVGKDYGELLAELIPPSYLVPHSSLNAGQRVLCDMALAVRKKNSMLGETGLHVKEMTVSGGQGKNPRWNQLKADITGIKLCLPEIADGELAGNAVLAAYALGAVSSIEDGANKMIRVQDTFVPNNTAYWEEKYII